MLSRRSVSHDPADPATVALDVAVGLGPRPVFMQTKLLLNPAALSVWSDQCRADGERFAIELLKNGIEQCGKEIPMACFRFLLDADDNHVDAKEIVTKDGRVVWILGDAAEAKYGTTYTATLQRTSATYAQSSSVSGASGWASRWHWVSLDAYRAMSSNQFKVNNVTWEISVS